MTFRKRLLVAFSTVIVVPLLLFTIAFIALGNYLIGEKGELQGYTSIVGGYDEYNTEVDEIYRRAVDNADRLQDIEVLDSLSGQIRGRNIYLAVRRNSEIYYSSNEGMTSADFDKLPAFDEKKVGGTGGSSFIYNSPRSLMVRQIDFLPCHQDHGPDLRKIYERSVCIYADDPGFYCFSAHQVAGEKCFYTDQRDQYRYE